MSKQIPSARKVSSDKPRIFIGSSNEAVRIAEAVQKCLKPYADCVVWNQMKWGLSKTPIAVLVDVVATYQYGIFVYAPDDIATIRKRRYLVARDNVVLEHGLFAGQLGHDRVFFVTPKVDGPSLRLPTDLLGLIHGHYDPKIAVAKPKAALASFCDEVREHITAVQTKLLRLRFAARIRETGTISGAASWKPIPKFVERLTYKPIEAELTYDREREWAEMRYAIRMRGEGVDFEGPCVARGEVHDGWAYMTYAATDCRTRQILKGLCLVRVPSHYGRPTYGYWMTTDPLASGADSITFGIGSTRLK